MMTRSGGNKNEQTSADILSKLPEQMEKIANAIRYSNNQMIDLFQNINNDLIQTIQSQGELTRQCIKSCFNDQGVHEEDKKELIDSLIKRTNETIRKSTKEMLESMGEMLKEQRKEPAIKVLTEKDKENKKLEDMWNKNLNKRKLEFYKHLRCKKIHDIYQKELEK